MRRFIILIALYVLCGCLTLGGVTTLAAQTNQPPAAAFTYAPSNPVSGQAVTFTNTSADPEGDPMQFWWTFGDGQTSPDGSPTITYAAPGTYTVELSATDNQHPFATYTRTIVVGQPGQISAPVVSVASATTSRTAGSSATATFALRNDNGVARTYALAATSSNTAIIADPAGPAQITVAASSSANVTVTYQVSASAAAGTTSVVRLQATDTADTTKTHSASFTHTTQASQGNQPPSAAFTYAPSNPVSGQPITFTNTSTDPEGDPMQFWWTFGDGQDSPYASPVITYAAPGTYTVELSATDNQHPFVTYTRTIVVGQPGQISAPVVSLSSATASRPAGAAATATFSIRNDNGTPRTYALVATSSNTAVIADPADPAQVTLGANSSVTVTVNYQVSALATSGSTAVVTLQATDTGDATKTHSASFTHTTQAAAATILPPGVDVVSYSESVPPGGTGTGVFRVTNRSSEPRGFTFRGISAHPNVIPDPADPAPISSIAAGAYADVTVTYQVPSNATPGSSAAIQLEANDSQDPSKTNYATFYHTTAAASLVAPVVQFGSAATSRPAGATGTATFTVHNNNGAPRAYSLSATSSNTAVVADPADPAQISVAANSSATVTVTYQVSASAAANSTAVLTLRATDTGDATRTHSAAFTHTTQAPAIVAPNVAVVASTPSAVAGAVVNARFSVTNPNASQRTYSFQATSSSPGVVSDPADPASIQIAAGGSAEVTVSYSVAASAAAGTTSTIQLTAADTIDQSKSHAASFTHTTQLQPDTTAPTIGFNRDSGTTVSDPNFQLTIDITDDRDLALNATVIYLNSADVTSTLAPALVATNRVRASGALQLAAGLNRIRVRGSDLSGNPAERELQVTYQLPPDTTGPSIEFNQPWGTTQTSMSFQLTVDVRDDREIQPAAVSVFHNGVDHTWVSTPTYTPAVWVQWATTFQLTPGLNTFRVLATDASGNRSERQLEVPCECGPDTTPPSIVLNRQSGTTQTWPDFQLTVDARDSRHINLDGVRVFHNGVDLTWVTTPTTVPPVWVQWATTFQLSPGANTFLIVARDASGNRSERELHVTYGTDSAAPTIEFNRDAGTTQSGPSFQITIDARDEVAINPSGVRVYFNGSEVTTVVQPTHTPPGWVQWAFTFQLNPGLNTIHVLATDVSGNVTERQLQVTWAHNPDTVAPTIESNQPTDSTQSTPSFQITFDLRDEREINRASLRVFLNGADVTNVVQSTFTPPTHVQWAFTFQLNPGANTVRATIADAAGNAAERTVRVTYSTGAPPPPPPPAASSKFTAYSVYASNIGSSHGIPIQYGGLDARQERQWIHWTGCAPNWHSNGDPDLGYDVAAVHAFAAANRGRHYIYLDEPAHGTPGNHKTNYTTPGCTMVTPAQYARSYKKFVDDLRAVDPTARVSPGGFEQVRATLQSYPTAFVEYATEFYDSYVAQFGAPPVTEWRFHMYWENGAWPDPSDISGWRAKTERAIAFGQQHGAPVVIGIGYPWNGGYDPRMLTGMDRMFEFLNANASVSSVFWWSYDFYIDGQNRLTTFNNEATTARTLTALGERYKALIGGAAPPPTPSVPVAVTPDSRSATVPASEPGSQYFRVQNVGTSPAVYTLTPSCSGAVTNCTQVYPSQVSLAAGETSGDVGVPYTMAASGSGWLTLKAVQQGVASVSDSGSYQLTALNPTANTFDVSVHNGENVNLAQFGANLTYTTPAYVTMDTPRFVTLSYSSVQASPRGFVQVEVNDAVPPAAYSILLQNPDGTPVVLANGGTENFYSGGSGGPARLAAQFHVPPSRGTGAYVYRVIVRRWNGGQLTSESLPQTVRVLIVDERNSAYGAGWSVEFPRIYPQNDGVLVTDGAGSAKFFPRPSGCGVGCVYRRPPGDWTDLRYDGTGYSRERRDGSKDVFGLDGFPTHQVDRFGNRTSYVFTDGRISEISDPAGHRITFGYTAGKLSTIDDGYGRVVTVNIDGAGDLRSITAPDQVKELQPDYSDHILNGWADRLGNRWDVSYDPASGMLAAVTAPSVSVTEGGVTWQTRPQTKQQSIQSAVLPTAASGATSLAAASPSVSAPPRLTVTDARDITSYVAVNRFGDPIRTWNALDQLTKVTRDGHSRIEEVEDPSGVVLRNEWEPDAPLLKKASDVPASSTTSYSYTAFDQVASVTKGTEETRFLFDTNHRLSGVKTKRADGTWEQHDITLTTDGRIGSVTDAADHTVTYDYTESDENPWRNLRFIEAGTRSQRKTTFSYNAYGLTLEVSKPSDDVTGLSVRRTEYDDVNQLTADVTQNGAPAPATKESRTSFMYVEEGGKLTTYLFDGRNSYTSVTNALGWVETQHDPLNHADVYRYDRAGNVTETVNRRQQKVVMEYDRLNRLSSRRDTSTNDTTTWNWDPVAGLWVEVRNAEGTNRITWNVAARETREQVTFTGLSSSYTLSSRYDGPAANVRSRVDLLSPWTRSAAYEYDTAGRLGKIVDMSTRATTIAYDEEGETESIALPANVNVRFGGTSQHVISAVAFENATTAAPLDPNLGSEYTLDAQGRIRTRWTTGNTALTYLYDFAGRLEEIWRLTYPVTPPECVDPDTGVCELSTDVPEPEAERTLRIDYDDAGNRTDGIAGTANRLLNLNGVTMTYDDDGNLISKTSPTSTQTFEWNALGQLVAATTDGSRTTFGYDGFGRRVRKSTPYPIRYTSVLSQQQPANVTRYLHDESNLFAELDANGQPLREYTNFPNVDMPLSVLTRGATYYYLMDMPGHVSGLVDSTGTVTHRYAYGPFGETTAQESGPRNPLRFGAREYDEETKLYYNRARYYDPSLGRFISEDPIGHRGGKNLYVFAENDPINRRDPSGLCMPESKFNELTKEKQEEALESGTVCGQKLKRYDLPGIEACGDCLLGMVSRPGWAAVFSMHPMPPINTNVEMSYGGPTMRARTHLDDFHTRVAAARQAQQCAYWKKKALVNFVIHGMSQARAGGAARRLAPARMGTVYSPPNKYGMMNFSGPRGQWNTVSSIRLFDDPNISAEWADAAQLFCGQQQILP